MKHPRLLTAAVLLFAGCSSGSEIALDGGEAAELKDTGQAHPDASTDAGGSADASLEDAAVADTGGTDGGEPDSGVVDSGSGDTGVADGGDADSGAMDTGGPDVGEDGGVDGGAGDGGADGGTGDPCEGAYPPQCLRELLESPSRCDPANAAAIDRVAREMKAAMELPLQYLDDAWIFYAGAASTVSVAGEFNAWTAAPLEKICALDLWALKVTTTGDKYEYKLVVDGTWVLDPGNRAFAYDDFPGNADKKNSVLNFWGSGKSHLEWWRNVASPQLGNTRDLYVYVPPYFNPMGAQAYPVLYMHDGQNIFDDKSSGMGNGGWETNVAADAEIVRAGLVPYFIVGVANTSDRSNEYTPCVEPNGGDPFGGKADLYEQFLIDTVIPLMEPHYHIYADGRAIAGSSLGGNISMYIGLRHPDLFPKGIGSLSGAFWVCQTEGQAVRDQVQALAGHTALPIYLDSGGDLASNADGARDTADVRDRLKNKGWLLWETSGGGACAGAYDLCHHLEPGAPHNEIAWRARVWRLLRYLF